VKQFILNKEPGKDNIVRLEGDDYHYLVRVRRLAVGEFFTALLPDGEEAEIQIVSIGRGTLTGRCNSLLNKSSVPPCCESAGSMCVNPSCKIVLFQALPKADKMDLIVRQAAESGITEIVPFVSEFSIAKTKADGQKYTRWEKIIKEARQQSGSKIATSLHKPLVFNELINYWLELKSEGALGLLFHHQVLAQKSLHGYLNSNPVVTAFAIGPEGGFSGAEVSLFMENGFNPITIGDTILRTETAALYCAAAIRILLLEKDSWELKKT
jgi:16S rRNA (uracil1498-N3)-methyltransferase